MNRAVGVAASVGMSPASVRSVFLLRRAFTSRVSASSSGSGSGVWSRISGVSRVSMGQHPALLQNWGLPTCVSVRGLRTARKSAPSKKPDAGVNEDKDGHAKADINTQANVDQFHEIRHAKKSLQEGKGSTALSQTEVEYSDISDPDAVSKSWSWVPPRIVEANTQTKLENISIPIIPKTLLTAEEIIAALNRMGGENAVKVSLYMYCYDMQPRQLCGV
jgi:hypothetical protein